VYRKAGSEFKRGRNNVKHEHCSGRPKDTASTDSIQIVNDMLKEDRRLTIRHIAETKDIHATTVYRIVSDDLGMKKVSARWVPRMLTDEQKQNHVSVCTDLLCHLQAQLQILLDRIVTQNETWVHHFYPETIRQSMVRKHANSSNPKKFNVTPSTGKARLLFFGTVKV